MNGVASLVISETGSVSGTELSYSSLPPQRRILLTALVVACALFFPVLASGTLWGQPVAGFVLPVGVSVMVGAFFSCIASGSLRGWLWIVFALFGTWVGLQLRPAFGLSGAPPLKL